ncbi:MAG: hypothetical protein ACREJ3_11930 [Polyangiaceae bacterium]
MAIHQTRCEGGQSVPFSLLLAAVLAVTLGSVCVSCGGSGAVSRPAIGPATPQAAATPPRVARSRQAPSTVGRGDLGDAAKPDEPGSDAQRRDSDEDDAELVVSRDVVLSCPEMRLVRRHMAEIDPQMMWLAVLESLAECMKDGGPMAGQNIGVSGNEEHRHVVREVLGSRGIAPIRVVATPVSGEGAAECQGGFDCGKRVEITLPAENQQER